MTPVDVRTGKAARPLNVGAYSYPTVITITGQTAVVIEPYGFTVVEINLKTRHVFPDRGRRVPGGRRPPAHRHTNCSEAYFDGLVSIIVEGEELTVGREGSVLVPRGTAHTFGNTSAEPARLLVIHTPAMDGYFAGLYELWNRPGPPSPDEERALISRFGMDPA